MSTQHTISSSCPVCAKTFELSAELIGAKGECDQCHTKFVIQANAVPQRKAAVQIPVMKPAPKKSGFPIGTLLLLGLLGGGGYYGYTEYSKGTPAENAKGNELASEGAAPAKQAVSELKLGSEEMPAVAPDSTAPAIADTAERVTAPAEAVVNVARKVTEQEAPKPVGAPLRKSFPVMTDFESIDLRNYQGTYPHVNQGWMPNGKEEAESALSWGHHLGPLGVRVRSHASQLQSRQAFVANVPQSIRTEDGDLGIEAAEVVFVAPGSPAEGYLQAGDLIVGIEGEYLKSGDAYRPDWKFMHKDRRELQLMFGEKIDQAQARGDVRLTVLRYGAEQEVVFSKKFSAGSKRAVTKKIAVTKGDEIHLIVNALGRNQDDHFAWLKPTLMGKGKVLDLTDRSLITADRESTGWGDVLYGKSVSGDSLGGKGIGVHASSLVVFTVPEGYDTFQTAMNPTHKSADLEAQVMVVKKLKNLPVRKQEIWSGSAGNKSAGMQSFEADVPGDGYITIRSDQSSDGTGGDGAVWMDLTLEGDYGTKKLLSEEWASAWAGWGSVKVVKDARYEMEGKTFDQILRLHADGEVKWKLPQGTKKVSGHFSAESYGAVQPQVFYTNAALPLTGEHKNKIVELRFPIGKAGGYSDTFPKNCPKSALTAKRHTTWLAAQQRENGSWSRPSGYTSDGWDTAWCALALMSSGDSEYDEQVRKAAYYLAYDTAPSEWAAERAMRLIFLSEYYLRTKDAEILAGIQSAYLQMEACCKTDFMSGHKVNGFGYGIAGQHYGTGHMALAFALASRTPIVMNQDLVEGVIRHAGEVCVNGTYAYGRGRRMARDDSREHGGGNAMVGPGMLGAMIGGGHQSAIKEVLERWDASVGDGDNSHATSTLAFIFSSLAMATGDEKIFLKHMQNFKYKMVIDDNWEGGFLKSAFPLDLQGGEGVTSTWIRSAGSILVLNALKHNLAITGKKELQSKKRIKSVAVSEWGGQVHSYYLRNWCLVQELLGRQAPRALSQGISALNALPRTMELVPKTRRIVMDKAPAMVAQIANNRELSELKKAYAIELLCGLDFKIYTKLEDGQQKVELQVNQPLQQLNWLDKDKGEIFADSPFPLDATVVITGENLSKEMSFNVTGLDGFDLDQGSKTLKSSATLKNSSKEEYKGVANISFKIGRTEVSYKRPLEFNTELSGANNTNLRRMRLKLRMAPRAYFQSQPLMIAGIAFDFMYPIERMVAVKAPEEGVVNIHEGDVVLADISSENMVCGWVNGLEFNKMSQVKIAKPRSVKSIQGTIEGDLKNLEDFDYDTAVQVKHEGGKSVLEYDFKKAITLNGLDANYSNGCFIRIWYKDRNDWIPLVWDNYTANTSHNPTFPDTEARLWRVEIKHGNGLKLHTLRFYQNPNRIIKRKPLLHSKGKGYPAAFQPS